MPPTPAPETPAPTFPNFPLTRQCPIRDITMLFALFSWNEYRPDYICLNCHFWYPACLTQNGMNHPKKAFKVIYELNNALPSVQRITIYRHQGFGELFVAFRGTTPRADSLLDKIEGWLYNFAAVETARKLGGPNSPTVGVHHGWWKIWDKSLKNRVINAVVPYVRDSRYKVWVTGHSQGGALSQIAALGIKHYLAYEPPASERVSFTDAFVRPVGFASPRPGKSSFRGHLELALGGLSKNLQQRRVTKMKKCNGNYKYRRDYVTKVPPSWPDVPSTNKWDIYAASERCKCLCCEGRLRPLLSVLKGLHHMESYYEAWGAPSFDPGMWYDRSHPWPCEPSGESKY